MTNDSLHCFHAIDESDSTYYGMRIVTGRDKGSGSITTGYFVNLLGSKGYSKGIMLQKHFYRHKLSRNSYDDVIIKVESNYDLGDIEVVMVGNKSYGSWFLECIGNKSYGSWFLECIELYQMRDSSKQYFPCRHWVVDGNNLTITSKTCKYYSYLVPFMVISSGKSNFGKMDCQKC